MFLHTTVGLKLIEVNNSEKYIRAVCLARL